MKVRILVIEVQWRRGKTDPELERKSGSMKLSNVLCVTREGVLY